MKGGNKSKTLFLAILKFCCAGGICNNKHIHLFSRPNLDLACLRSQTFFSDLFLRLVFDFIAEKKMKKEGLHHSPLFFFFFGQKCNPLRPFVGNTMYPDHEVLRKTEFFSYFIDFIETLLSFTNGNKKLRTGEISIFCITIRFFLLVAIIIS